MKIDFDRQDFAHPFVQEVERSELPPAIECVTHEVHRPTYVRLRAHIQWLDHSNWHPLLPPAWHIEPKLAIHAPQPFVVPALSGAP